MPQYFPTFHCTQKMSDRNITWPQILQVIHDPEITYRGEGGRHQNCSATYQRGNLYVIVAEVPQTNHAGEQYYPVITCGLRSIAQWTDSDARSRNVKEKS